MQTKKVQAYDDGVAFLFKVIEESESGDMPTQTLRFLAKLRFQEKTVGMTRFQEAKQNDDLIERKIRVHKLPSVTADDVVAIGDSQYLIDQIQYIEEVLPPGPSMDLTLKRAGETYEID